MVNEGLSSLTKSSIRLDQTSPIRRITADVFSLSHFDSIHSNEQFHLSRNFPPPSISLQKTPQTFSYFAHQSTVSRQRSMSSSSRTSSSSKSSADDSFRSFSSYSSTHHEDDASSSEEITHQWNFNQVSSHRSTRQSSKCSDDHKTRRENRAFSQ